MNLLVSACLLGEKVRFDGKSSYVLQLVELCLDYNLSPVPICPAVMGGLPTPRVQNEIKGTQIVSKYGTPVTHHYDSGAQQALEKALEFGCEFAVLKSESPSCGNGHIYSGNFDGSLVEGDGITTKLLKNYGIEVYSESQLSELEVALKKYQKNLNRLSSS